MERRGQKKSKVSMSNKYRNGGGETGRGSHHSRRWGLSTSTAHLRASIFLQLAKPTASPIRPALSISVWDWAAMDEVVWIWERETGQESNGSISHATDQST